MANLGSLAAIAQIGGAAASAGSAYTSYTGALAQSKYQANVLNQNAALAQMQGQQAMDAGAFQAAMRGLQAGQAVGKQRAYTSGNVDVNTGSAAKVQQDIAAAGAVDQAQIMSNAALQRWGYGVEAENYRNQARMAKIGGRFRANSAIAGGLSDIGGAGLRVAYYGKKAGWFDPAAAEGDSPYFMRPPG